MGVMKTELVLWFLQRKVFHVTQKEVSETEINAKAYGQGENLFSVDLPYH